MLEAQGNLGGMMEVLYILIWSSDCSSIYLTKLFELCVLNKGKVLVTQPFPTL